MFLAANAVSTAKNPEVLPATLIIATPLSCAWDSVYPASTNFCVSSKAVSNPMLLSVIGIAFVIYFGITQNAIFSFLFRKTYLSYEASWRVPGPPIR